MRPVDHSQVLLYQFEHTFLSTFESIDGIAFANGLEQFHRNFITFLHEIWNSGEMPQITNSWRKTAILIASKSIES